MFDMKNSLLIPNRCKVFGWIIFVVFGFIGWQSGGWDLNPIFTHVIVDQGWHIEIKILTTIGLIGAILGLMMICFSREKQEDEYISLIRLKSWQWAILISYCILIIASAIVYGISFLQVMLFNMFTTPLIFIIKFYYSLYRLKKEGLINEK
jgi:hypothetical protein